MIQYRNLQVEEAETFWKLMNQMDQETKYMLYYTNEREKNIPLLTNIIQNANENGFLKVVEIDNTLVGYISAQREVLIRSKHCAYIVIGILKNYHNQKIGSTLFELLIDWAKTNNIKRLELNVLCENEKAVHLYKKYGFEIEGIRRNSTLLDGEYKDEYYMAKIL